MLGGVFFGGGALCLLSGGQLWYVLLREGCSLAPQEGLSAKQLPPVLCCWAASGQMLPFLSAAKGLCRMLASWA